MKIEKLNYGRNKKIFLYGLLLGVGLIIGISFNTSMAKYKVTQSIPIAKGKITNYKVADLNVVAMYQQGDNGYQEINDVPTSGYTLNTTESYCGIPDTSGNIVKDSTIPMEYKEGKVYIGVSKKRTKCYLYFDEKLCDGVACNQILANMPTISERTDFSQVMTNDTPGTIYKANDNDGTSYYFAGVASDNWVKFGKDSTEKDLYWRIIRINGDNTIRMIYAGTDSSVTIGTGTQKGTSKFNGSYSNNMYVGYMYTSGSVHGFGSSSTIKGVLDKWYDDNLAANFGKYIDTNAGFCGDRQPSTSTLSINGSGGTGTTATYYAARYRLQINKTPTLECKDNYETDVDIDLYTMLGANKGNAKLTKPIGLITADEVAYAGGVLNAKNSGYYLYTNSTYWTMTPSEFSGGFAAVFNVFSNGYLYNNPAGSSLNSTYGVRPVINLRADTQFSSGNGTAENPYVVK